MLVPVLVPVPPLLPLALFFCVWSTMLSCICFLWRAQKLPECFVRGGTCVTGWRTRVLAALAAAAAAAATLALAKRAFAEKALSDVCAMLFSHEIGTGPPPRPPGLSATQTHLFMFSSLVFLHLVHVE